VHRGGIGRDAVPVGDAGSISKIEIVELVETEIPALKAASNAEYGGFLKTFFTDERYGLHVADDRNTPLIPPGFSFWKFLGLKSE
jgi:hypothetical protein